LLVVGLFAALGVIKFRDEPASNPAERLAGIDLFVTAEARHRSPASRPNPALGVEQRSLRAILPG
jgi:hypothetical protein